VDLAKVASDAQIEVYAYTDNMGTDDYNEWLSQHRADRIKAILVAEGFDADKITPVGRGEYEPIADNKTEEGRAENRRVEFHVRPSESDIDVDHNLPLNLDINTH
jgi:outer membrane protein OmpA-like peptidoglycan-associated protein